jgi:hypothetical protein
MLQYLTGRPPCARHKVLHWPMLPRCTCCALPRLVTGGRHIAPAAVLPAQMAAEMLCGCRHTVGCVMLTCGRLGVAPFTSTHPTHLPTRTPQPAHPPPPLQDNATQVLWWMISACDPGASTPGEAEVQGRGTPVGWAKDRNLRIGWVARRAGNAAALQAAALSSLSCGEPLHCACVWNAGGRHWHRCWKQLWR